MYIYSLSDLAPTPTTWLPEPTRAQAYFCCSFYLFVYLFIPILSAGIHQLGNRHS